uniref:ANF_receptor domain-containing protein n=1 Tax=Steinernema glaseri TaxID=37863 RepID=A0A1I7ZAK5_9BILA
MASTKARLRRRQLYSCAVASFRGPPPTAGEYFPNSDTRALWSAFPFHDDSSSLLLLENLRSHMRYHGYAWNCQGAHLICAEDSLEGPFFFRPMLCDPIDYGMCEEAILIVSRLGWFVFFSLLAGLNHVLAIGHGHADSGQRQRAVTVDDPSYLSSHGHVRNIRIPGDLIIGGVFPVHAKDDSPDGHPCGEIAETSYLSSHGHVRNIRIPGDLIIGGVFPVHAKDDSPDGHPCGEIAETRGVHRVEAMLYALDIINAQKDFLRGYKLGALILDSCSNPAYALNQSLDFVRDLIGSSDVSEYQCADGSSPENKYVARKNVVAVVGGSYSSVTVQMNVASNRKGLPQAGIEPAGPSAP